VASAAVPQKTLTYTLPPDLYRRAHNRGHLRFAIDILKVTSRLLILWLILQLGWSARLRDWAECISHRRFLQGLSYTATLFSVYSVLHLPLDLFEEWVLKFYGISVRSWPSWVGEWLLALAVTIVIVSPGVLLVYLFIRYNPRRWWFYFWMSSIPLLALGIFLWPSIISPLFNTYEPLSARAPELIAPLQQVTRRAGVTVPPERMYWMRASDKFTYSNAEVIGFGASTRIVVWDTAINLESHDGLLSVYGHELGHYVLNHVRKGFLLAIPLALGVALLSHFSIGRLLARKGTRWGVRSLHDWASLPVLLLLLALFGFAAQTAGNAFSRHIEHEADVYAIEVLHGIVSDPGQAGALSLQKFGEQATLDPDPNRVAVFFFFDHPPVGDRIRFHGSYDPWAPGQVPLFVNR